MNIYEPREDSYLLEKWVEMLAHGKVLDMGTGSGIQALAALKKAKSVLAVDVNQEALDELQKKANIPVKKSDLFKSILEKFDMIIFNPPYLPQDVEIEDQSIYGGKEGYEVLVEFLRQARQHLNQNGFILFLFSSLTNKKRIDKTLDGFDYTWSLLEEQKMDFESLYVYKAWQ
ncbi:HemK2/MTQ2 family protein methyltransferase [Nanoarchaeota archaeon]